MFNAKKAVSAIMRRIPIFKLVASGSMANSVANQWFYTTLQFTVPAGHTYLVRVNAGYNTGKPIGLGLHNSTTVSAATGAPIMAVEGSYTSYSPVWLVNEGTYYVFCKRAGSSGSNKNNYLVHALDFKISGGGTA